jgi:hypothetical protein
VAHARRSAVHDLVGQRESVPSDDQRDHDPQTARPSSGERPRRAVELPSVSLSNYVLGVVQQHVEVGSEELGPLLAQPHEERGRVIEKAVLVAHA